MEYGRYGICGQGIGSSAVINKGTIGKITKKDICIQCVTVESGLGQKYAFTKKSTILIQSLQNFDKRRYSWGPYFDKVS